MDAIHTRVFTCRSHYTRFTVQASRWIKGRVADAFVVAVRFTRTIWDMATIALPSRITCADMLGAVTASMSTAVYINAWTSRLVT